MNDDFFLLFPRLKLPQVKPQYTISLSLTRMRANPEFDLTKITKYASFTRYDAVKERIPTKRPLYVGDIRSLDFIKLTNTKVPSNTFDNLWDWKLGAKKTDILMKQKVAEILEPKDKLEQRLNYTRSASKIFSDLEGKAEDIESNKSSEQGTEGDEMKEFTALAKLSELDAEDIKKRLIRENRKKAQNAEPTETIQIGDDIPKVSSENSKDEDHQKRKRIVKKNVLNSESMDFIVSDEDAHSKDISEESEDIQSSVKTCQAIHVENILNDEDFKYVAHVRIDYNEPRPKENTNSSQPEINNQANRRSSIAVRRPSTIRIDREIGYIQEINNEKAKVENINENKEENIEKDKETQGKPQRSIWAKLCCKQNETEEENKKKKKTKKEKNTNKDYFATLKKKRLEKEQSIMDFFKRHKYERLQLDTYFPYDIIMNQAFSSYKDVVPRFFESKKVASLEQQVLSQENIRLPMHYSVAGLASAQIRALKAKSGVIEKDVKTTQTSSSKKLSGLSSDRNSSDSEIDNFEESFRADIYETRKCSKKKQDRHDFFHDLEKMVVFKPFPIQHSKNKAILLQSMKPRKGEEETAKNISQKQKKKDGFTVNDFNADEAVVLEKCSKDKIEVEKAFKDLRLTETHHDFKMLYLCIKAQDSSKKAIEKYNWSGNQILSTGAFTVSQTAKTVASLNNQKLEIWREGCKGFIITTRRYCREFMDSSPVNMFLMSCVFLNTLILATDGLTPELWSDFLSNLNTAFTVAFTLEMIIKLYGLGLRVYCKDAFNIFDGLIVILSLVELSITIASSGGGGKKNATSAFRAVRVFRILRVLRVTRLLRSLRFMKVIIEVLKSTFEQFIYIALLMFLFVFIFTLLGTQIFGNTFKFDNYDYNPVRFNFDSFTSAFFTVFTVLTLENWNSVLVSCLRSDTNSVISVFYLIAWIFIGNYIFINLFLSILLEGFEKSEALQQIEEIDHEGRELARTHKRLIKDHEEKLKKAAEEAKESVKEVQLITMPEKYENEEVVKKHDACYMIVRNENEDNESLSDHCDVRKYLAKTTFSNLSTKDPYEGVTCYRSLYYFKKTHPFRKFCARLYSHSK